MIEAQLGADDRDEHKCKRCVALHETETYKALSNEITLSIYASPVYHVFCVFLIAHAVASFIRRHERQNYFFCSFFARGCTDQMKICLCIYA
jgi:hypothetical protein